MLKPPCISGVRVLVLEDDIITQKQIKHCLEKGKCKVTITGNADEALSIVALNEIDIILMDLNLSDTEGFMLTHRIRQADNTSCSRYIPIMALTGALVDKCEFLEAGMDEILLKPYRSETLYQRIGQLIDAENNWVESKRRIQEIFKDDLGILKEISEEFIDNRYAEDIFQQIQDALHLKDYIQIAKLAHKLKGCFSYFQVQTLSDHIKELEKATQQQAEQRIIDTFLMIQYEYRRLERLLGELNQQI